jgi:hypothetical protein
VGTMFRGVLFAGCGEAHCGFELAEVVVRDGGGLEVGGGCCDVVGYMAAV